MSSPLRGLVSALGFILVVGVSVAGAQSQVTDGWAAGRWRFGPLAVTPKIELRNLGWDNNVFNETSNPKTDFTAALAPQIDWWFRAGRARLHGIDLFEGIFFAKYPSQGGFNQRHDLTLLVPLNRLRPYVGGYYFTSNDRPGFEINARLRHTEVGVNAGVVVSLTNRISVDISGRQTVYRFQDIEGEQETSYALGLNRRTENYGAQIRYRVTPLTTFSLLADAVRERFTESPERNNDGFRILPGVEFDPYALIKGKAQVGYRMLNSRRSGMPDFSGPVASADLSYAFRGMTRFGLGVVRDIYFSYETTQPFYVQTGLMLNAVQQVGGPFDLQVRGGWYRLDYRQAESADGTTPGGRIDHYRTWGGGIGYRLGRDIRIGLNIDSFRRDSALQAMRFQGIRGGMAVTYVPK